MPSSFEQKPVHVTLLGDSTIDNRIWVDGLKKNLLLTKLGIRHSTPDERIEKYKHGLFKPELSVVENLRVQLPEHFKIHDGTNDGFTSRNVLSGALRSKVFGSGTFSMFPDEWFEPLKVNQANIQKSDYIVLSVGGNDVREFLQDTFAQPKENQQAYIKAAFPEVLKRLNTNYLEIIRRVREINPQARIVLMTQYYPSASQNTYNIYQFMSEVGKALNIGGDQHDPMDVIQHVVSETYKGIINELKDDNVLVADVTSSLNPFDNENHTSQIEPSGKGGKKIAKMLHHLLTTSTPVGEIYQFTPEFFDGQNDEESIVNQSMAGPWMPLHPRTISSMDDAHNTKNKVTDAKCKPLSDTNYFFILKALAALTVSALAIALVWLTLPTVVAAVCTIAVTAVAGYAGYRLFTPAVNKGNEEPVDPNKDNSPSV